MLDKLEPIERKYEEIDQELLKVGDDYQRAADLSREKSELEPLVELAREYRSIYTRIEEAHALLDGDDPQLKE